MTSVSVQELQHNADAVLRRVENGESVFVVRGTLPVAEITPIPAQSNGLRPIGLCAGEFTVPPDFDDPLPETVLREFEGQ